MHRTANKTYQMLIVEDHIQIQRELGSLFAAQPDIELVGVVGTLSSAVAALDESIDVILLDLGLPDGAGHEVIRKAKSLRAGIKVIVFTVFADDAHTLSAIEAGADAYLLKGTPDVAEQVRRTLRGENPIAPGVTQHLLHQLRRNPQSSPTSSLQACEITLTPRERETLTALAQGLSYQEIADSLRISNHTLTDYSKSLYRKLGVHSRAEAVLHGVKLGLVSF